MADDILEDYLNRKKHEQEWNSPGARAIRQYYDEQRRLEEQGGGINIAGQGSEKTEESQKQPQETAGKIGPERHPISEFIHKLYRLDDWMEGLQKQTREEARTETYSPLPKRANFVNEQGKYTSEGKQLISVMAAQAAADGKSMEEIEYTFGSAYSGMMDYTNPGLADPMNFIIDLMTGFTMPLGKTALRQMTKAGMKKIGTKNILKSVSTELAYGGAATGFMGLADWVTEAPLISMLAGFIGPTAAFGVTNLSRRGLAQFLKGFSQSRPNKFKELLESAMLQPEGKFAQEIITMYRPDIIRERFAELGIKMEMYYSTPDLIDAHLWNIPQEFKQPQLAVELFKEMTDVADATGKTIQLMPWVHGRRAVEGTGQGAPQRKLRKFYEKYGFRTPTKEDFKHIIEIRERHNAIQRPDMYDPLTPDELTARIERQAADDEAYQVFKDSYMIRRPKETYKTPLERLKFERKAYEEVKMHHHGILSASEGKNISIVESTSKGKVTFNVLNDENIKLTQGQLGRVVEYLTKQGYDAKLKKDTITAKRGDVKFKVKSDPYNMKRAVEIPKYLRAARSRIDIEKEINRITGFDTGPIEKIYKITKKIEDKVKNIDNEIAAAQHHLDNVTINAADNRFLSNVDQTWRRSIANQLGQEETPGIFDGSLYATNWDPNTNNLIPERHGSKYQFLYSNQEAREDLAANEMYSGAFFDIRPENIGRYRQITLDELLWNKEYYNKELYAEYVNEMKAAGREISEEGWENYIRKEERYEFWERYDELDDYFDSLKAEGYDSVLIRNMVDDLGQDNPVVVLLSDDWKDAFNKYTEVNYARRSVEELMDVRLGIDYGEMGERFPFLKGGHVSDVLNKYAGNINLNRIHNPEDIKKVINTMQIKFADEIDEARRKTITHEETVRMANLLGMKPADLLARRRGQSFNAEELLASRMLLVASANNLARLAEKVRSGFATPLERFEFARATGIHYAIQAQVAGATAEAGRALSAQRIVAKATKTRENHIIEFLKQMEQKDIPLEALADGIATAGKSKGVAAVTDVVRGAQGASAIEMLAEVWINALLSNPITHAVNFTSNYLTALWLIPERRMASAIGNFRGRQHIDAQEWRHQLYGFIEGHKDGIIMLRDALKDPANVDNYLKTELRLHENVTAENFRRLLPGDQNWLAEGGPWARMTDLLASWGLRMPSRLLNSSDMYFKAIGYRQELRARAFRDAMQKYNKNPDKMAEHMNLIMRDPEKYAPDLHLAAIDASRYATYTRQPGIIGSSINRIAAKHPFVRFIVPFVRTPGNILKFVYERSPLAAGVGLMDTRFGQARTEIGAALKAGGAEADIVMARIALGSMIMVGAGMAAGAGMITGGGPTDKELLSHMRNTGWQPYSIWNPITGQWMSYQRVEPLGMTLGLGADMYEIISQMDEVEGGELAAAAVMAIAKNTTSKTWLRGVSEALAAFNSPDRESERWVHNFTGSWIPSGIAQMERIMDPEMRAVYNMIDAAKARIPGYSKDLPPYRNNWGEARKYEGSIGPDWLSPFYASTPKDSPVDEELIRMRRPVQMPRKRMSIRGIDVDLMKIDPKGRSYDNFIQLMNKIPLSSTGRPLKQSLDHMVLYDPNYKNYADDFKFEMIQSKIDEARQNAKEALYNTDSKVHIAVEQGKMKLQMRGQ